MNKIRLIANQDTNYVFHMLSVANCGYDNAYGAKFRDLYLSEDLKVIKRNEKLLTVCGGEYCGELYGLLVCEPACAKISAKAYYRNLQYRTEQNDVAEELKSYIDIIKSISEVMIQYYDSYIDNIWPVEKVKIELYIPQVHDVFEKMGFTDKAEECVGCELLSEFFTITLVTSVENGAEAIDISKEQDLFGIERDYLDAVYFIGHEFVIYLLFNTLGNTNAFKCFETWPLTEGLAEFYLKKIMGDTRFFDSQQKYVEFYENCEQGRSLSAYELYRMALALDRRRIVI